MIGGHADRAHALLSASGSHRWLTCTPSALLEAEFPDTTSEAAAEGTLAHELAEGKLLRETVPDTYSAQKLAALRRKLKQNPLWSEEMEPNTDFYVETIDKMAIGFPSAPSIYAETKLDLSDWVPDGFGTADCIMIGNDTIQVFDLKYGKGVQVFADHNPQMMLYALGAYKKYGFIFPFKKARMTIIQPRLNHVSDFECSIEELLQFGEFVKEKAALAMKGEGEFVPSAEACRFCRAKARCRARADKNVQLVDKVGQLPPLITEAEAGKYLKIGADVAKWLSDLQEWALTACLDGADIPGWKAVEGRSTRKWTDQEAAFDALKAAGINEELLWERKPLTLSQVEKVVGKKQFGEIASAWVEKSSGKPALVEESDKRPAISNRTSVEEAFK